MAEAAAALEAGPTQLARSFSDAFAIPPHAYVDGRRLEAARARILAGQPLADVAAEVGFVDQAHLTRRFRRFLGTTPGQFGHGACTPALIGRAVPELTYRATLDHPPGVVFDYVADAENNPTWHEHVRETRWIDDGPTRLGRRGRQTGRLFWRDWHFVAEVAEWDPPHLVAFQVIEGHRIRTTIRVGAVGRRDVMWLTVRTPRILGRRIDGLVSRLMQRTMAKRERGDIARLRVALAARDDRASSTRPPAAARSG